MARNTSVMGIYADRATVSAAIDVLHKAGYRAPDISVLSSDNQGSKDFAHEKHNKALAGAATGAAAGAVVGSALAWSVSTQAIDHHGFSAARRGWTATGCFGWRRCRRGSWVGSRDCWQAWALPNMLPSATQVETEVAAFSCPFTATVRSGVTGRREP